MNNIKLAPSDFAFLYEDCPRCFYLKTVARLYPPSKPMAKIFTKIDEQQKIAFENSWLSDIVPGFPECQIVESDRKVTSTHFTYPDLDYSHYIFGVIDSLVKFKDGTYGVIDFKTSEVTTHLPLYQRQLHAYALALSKPMNPDELLDGEISRLGLVIFNPRKGFEAHKDGTADLKGDFLWQEVPYKPQKFVRFMREVAESLSGAEPEFNPNCKYCVHDAEILKRYTEEV